MVAAAATVGKGNIKNWKWWILGSIYIGLLQSIMMMAVGVDGLVLEGSVIMNSAEGWQTMVEVSARRAKVVIHISCIAGVWFGLGFGSNTMNGTYAIVVDGNGAVTERQLGAQDAGEELTPGMVEVVKSVLIDDTRHRYQYRYVILEREISSTDDRFYSFPLVNSSVDVIYARGNTSDLGRYVVYGTQKLLLGKYQCTALRSYIQIANETLLSAMSLFGPFEYPTKLKTNVTVLSTNEEWSYCSKGFTTDLSNSIVLLARGGNCTEHKKVKLAEEAGAAAVFIYNNEDMNAVEEIVQDEPSLGTPNIPVRMISQVVGWDIKANNGAKVKMQCIEERYPLALCFSDTNGDYWHLNGEYQMQVEVCDSCGPIWKRAGFPGVLADAWIFMSNKNSRWEISYAAADEDYSWGYCSETLASPGECKIWYMYQGPGYEYDDGVIVSESVCEVAITPLCLQPPTNSKAGGLKGTYHQISNKSGYWTREMMLEDLTYGILLWGYWQNNPTLGTRRLFDASPSNTSTFDPSTFQASTFQASTKVGTTRAQYDWVWGFGLIDYTFQLQQILVAYCVLGTMAQIGGSEAWQEAQYHPENCSQWYVLEDCNAYSLKYIKSESFSITNKACPTPATGNHGTEDLEIDDHSPETLCISQPGPSYQIFLSGEYTKIDGMSTSSGRKVWENLRLKNTELPAYIWYFGDVNSFYRMWIIADSLPTTTKAIGVYAYCASDTDTPTECWGCWNFYEAYCFEAVCDVKVHGTTCPTTTAPPASVYPQDLCVRSQVENTLTMTGSYTVSTSKSTSRPVWEHQEYKDMWYIFYDDVLRMWQIGKNVTDGIFYCIENADWDPSTCFWGKSDFSWVNITVKSDSCSSQLNTDGVPKEKKKKNHTTGVAVGVGMSIIVVVWVAGIVYYLKAKGKICRKQSVNLTNDNYEGNFNAEKHQVFKSTAIPTSTKPEPNKRESYSLELGKTQWETIDVEEHERQKQAKATSSKNITTIGIPEAAEGLKGESDNEESDGKGVR